MNAQIIQAISAGKSHIVGVLYRAVLLGMRCNVARNISYASHTNQRLDIYRPIKGRAQSSPVIVIVHGGGWISGDKRERALFAATLTRRGYIVCVINYRLAPQHPYPAAIDDFVLAMNWIYTYIESYGGSPRKMTVIGDSAGAHIATLGITASDRDADTNQVLRSIAKLVLYYGIYDLVTLQNIQRLHLDIYHQAFMGATNNAQQNQACSPIRYVKYFPPTLLVASEVDPLCPQTLELADALRTHHCKHELLLLDKKQYPHAKHGFQSLAWGNAAKVAMAKTLEFLAND